MIVESGRANSAAARIAEFADRCHSGGLAVTPQRLAIIRALLGAADHPRAETIYEKVRREHPHISLATVHRTLETLCRIGEARKVTALHDSARYDGNTAPHHHVVCVGCRRIRDIYISDVERLLDGRGDLGEFRVMGCALEIHALCAQCQQKQKLSQGVAQLRTKGRSDSKLNKRTHQSRRT